MGMSETLSSPSLDEWLVSQGKLSEADRQRALRVQEGSDDSLFDILHKLGLVSERDLAQAVADLYRLPLLGSKDYPDLPATEQELAAPRFLKQHHLLPLELDEQTLTVACADPGNRYALQALALRAQRRVVVRVGLPSEIEAAFERLYGAGRSAMGRIVESLGGEDALNPDDIEHLKDMASEAPVIRLVNLMIQRAVEIRASDIHIEPFENRLKVRYRVDGVMREVESPPARLSAAVISRIKIMAKLNIAERRLPQDGRIQLRVQGHEIDLRVSTVPTLHGESVVMRILDKSGVVFDFERLGFTEGVLQRYLRTLELPHGIILVTGPTGSGKSTTLYTSLIRLNTPEVKILTVEDPVEYQLEGVNQIQVKPQIDLTFANALRAIVRQDPDIIMIGEVRDRETAAIAVQSALTGHLVLSTLHTNDAAGAITRLLDMGMEDYLLTSTINGVLGQRLVRTLCPQCKRSEPALPELVEELGLQRFSGERQVRICHPVGCEHCGGSGYRGRAAINEFLEMTDPIRRLVLKHASAGDIQAQARQEGMLTLYEDGLAKVVAGLTTVEEVLRVIQES